MNITFFGIHGGVPSQYSGNVSFVVREGDWQILVDTSGNPVQSLLASGIEPHRLDAVAVTHSHTDHVYAFPSLIHTLWLMGRTKELICYTGAETEKFLISLLDCFGLREKEHMFPLTFLRSTRAVPPDGLPRVELVPVSHSVETHGLIIRQEQCTILYSSDTAPCETIIGMNRSVHVLIHEASGLRPDEYRLNPAGHSSARQAAEAAGRLGVQALLLCHVSPDALVKTKILDEARRYFTTGSVCIPVEYREYQVEGL